MPVRGSDVRAIRSNGVRIPMEAPLPDSFQILLIGFVTIHINQPVSLLVAVEPAQDIRERPDAISNQVDAIDDGVPALLEVGAKVCNSVLVVHGIIRLQHIELTETVFRDQYRQLIAAAQAAKSNPQSH